MRSLRTPVVAVAAMFFLNGAFFGGWASRIPSIKEGFGLSPDALGLLLLLLAAGAIVSFPFAGAATDRYGAARVTWWLAVFYAAALMMIGVAREIWFLAIALFLFGVTHGAMDVAMNAWGAEVERRARRPILSMLHAIFSLGAGVGAAFGVGVLKLDWSVTQHFLSFAVLATLPCMVLANIDWTSDTSAKIGGGRLFNLPKGVLILVGIIAFCSAMGEGAMADWSALFLVETVAASESQAAAGYAVFSVAMVLARLFGHRVIQSLGAFRTTQLSGVTAFIGILLAVFGTSVFVVLCGYAFMGLGFALIMPLAFSKAANDPDQPSGTAIASVATLGYGGLLLGPPIIGFLAEHTSFETSFLLLALLAVMISLLAKAVETKR
ncbi:MFS transporter [Denitrobaculum tricleocarpae]|uniref:MFS transporter n=1 Tax=Denitrobaculum tricleocarpae TaxID=2591009 RepID=A0A545T5N6_9PROT|nr:MFS transporter [Denitrobaculum tricleocarpae]TQV72546.1 MFS transporter [Denitrobaculum tricleocarpae]